MKQETETLSEEDSIQSETSIKLMKLTDNINDFKVEINMMLN